MSSASDPRRILPDVLARDLDIVFCGTAAGSASARKGAYYAGPGNAFWRTLYEVRLISRPVRPEDFTQLSEWNMGFTDLAKTVSGSDSTLSKTHFDAARLRQCVLEHRPGILAFTGKRAAQEFLGRNVEYGLLPDAIGTTRLFVLPSPSGAARRYWDVKHWHELSRLRTASGRQVSGETGKMPACARSSAG